MALPDRVALDACALIHWANPQSPYEPAMSEWLRLGLLVGQVEMGGSTAMLIEARGSGSDAPNSAAEKRIRAALLDPKFVLVNLDRATSVLARELALKHSLKTWDAVHLASAVRFDADVLLTTDTRLLSVARVGRLEVKPPYDPAGSHLFSDPDDSA